MMMVITTITTSASALFSMSAHGGAPALEAAPLEHPSSRPSAPGLHHQHQQSQPASALPRTSPAPNPDLHTWRSLASVQAGPWEAALTAAEQPRLPPAPVATSAGADRAASTSTAGYPVAHPRHTPGAVRSLGHVHPQP